MNFKFLILIFSLFLILFYIGNAHEDVHISIFHNYGIDSQKGYYLKIFPSKTIVDSSEYNLKCNEKCKELHTWNEIIGYNVISLILGIILLITAYSFYSQNNEVKTNFSK